MTCLPLGYLLLLRVLWWLRLSPPTNSEGNFLMGTDALLTNSKFTLWLTKLLLFRVLPGVASIVMCYLFSTFLVNRSRDPVKKSKIEESEKMPPERLRYEKLIS